MHALLPGLPSLDDALAKANPFGAAVSMGILSHAYSVLPNEESKIKVTKHQPGMFSWADLATPDAEGSGRFYTELLDLDAADTLGAEGMVYSMLSKEGRASCAIYEMPPEMKQMTGGSAKWTSYFTVEDADATAGRIQELGGTVQGPFDVFTSGRMGFGVDPTGAVFAIWQPSEQIGAEIFGEPGALAWSELSTHDTQAAAKFYAGLFGWSAMATPSADGGEYTLFELEDQPAAGMIAIREEWGPTPANWSIYFAIADLERSRAKARELGATEITPVSEVEGVGRFVCLNDPQGAYVTIIQMTGGMG